MIHTQITFIKLLLSAALLLLTVFPGFAGTISTWNVARDSTAGSNNSGLNTNSPTFGDGTADNIEDGFFTGEFGETVSLGVGETLTVTYDLTLTGGNTNAGQYRFVTGNYGATADQSWTGAWNHVTDEDLYQGRTDGNIQSTGGNALDLDASKSTTGSFDGNSPTNPFTYSISITRDSSTTVDLVSSLSGGDFSFDQTYTENDLTTSLFDYNGVGILFGGNSEADQASISNAQYSVIPEPSTLVLTSVVGLVLLIGFRRRR